MNKHNTIFGQILAQVERPQFDKLVRDCKHEFGAKGMKSWTQFASMALGQISGQNGLRGIEASMNAQTSSFYHLGISSAEKREVKRSTLSYANNHRTSKLYERLFYKMYEKAGKRSEGHGFRFKNKLYSVDATTIDLCLKLFPWAAFRENKGGVKLTVKLDHRGKIPAFVIFGNAREHESKKIKEIPFEAEDIAVFDRGFTDYGYFRALNDQKVWFVTRLKKNAAYRIIKKNESKSKNIKSDYEIKIPKYCESETLRKIIAVDPETGKKITLLTNNHEWAASTVGAIYRDRWQIELFFKAIKQNLKIKRFYGNSRNAVLTQIWIALIVYLIYYILKCKAKNFKKGFTDFIHIIRTMMFQRTSLPDWMNGKSPPPIPDKILYGQGEFAW